MGTNTVSRSWESPVHVHLVPSFHRRRPPFEAQVRSLRLPPKSRVTELDAEGCTALAPERMDQLRRARRLFLANGRAIRVQHASPTLRRQLIQAGLADVVAAPPANRDDHRASRRFR
jgi:hypothetical protein